jgi:hypothetical protein
MTTNERTKIIMRDGRAIEGTPLEIVRAMKDLAFGVEHLSLGQYIDSCVADAMKFEGVAMKVPLGTDEERATALVDEMLRTGLTLRPQ